ncbi:TIGR04372 family glycosyltransferase [Nisaea acidiphila]|uniref:TIGR04372 family glycosyltransferase n=1 Tax=Nisaea acidiphila TaxID=1862145 RepID=A0A9J7AQD1_9PROT|nr:TIGR04372 family glycosyltransferase [Nisaea acidiphila]UUX49431.1 TIGR04372 family glycosyltransferase [Nisaea acidiphila]
MTPQEHLAELNKPETLQELYALVQPHLREGEKALVYPLPFAIAIGHLAPEPHYLASLYDEVYDKLVLLTPPRALPRINKPLFDILSNRFAMVETQNVTLLTARDLDLGMTSVGPFDFCLEHTNRFYRAFTLHCAAGKRQVHLGLDPGARERGESWLKNEAGIDPGTPFVVMHVREPNYSNDSGSASFGRTRVVDPESFRPAVDWLLEAGYAVFRIGRPGSPPFRHVSSRVLDLANEDRGSDFLDVYLSAACAFSLNCMSGPEALARAFGRPSVNTNLLHNIYAHHLPEDLFLFKKFHIRDSTEPLSYEEQLELKMPSRMVLGPLPDSRWYEAEQIRAEACTPEDILGAVREMHDRLSGARQANPANERFLELSRSYENSISRDEQARSLGMDIYSYAHGMGELSSAWANLNPWFLG